MHLHMYHCKLALKKKKKEKEVSVCESLPRKLTLGKYFHWLCFSEVIRPPKIFG